jgi:hypothetical protein
MEFCGGATWTTPQNRPRARMLSQHLLCGEGLKRAESAIRVGSGRLRSWSPPAAAPSASHRGLRRNNRFASLIGLPHDCRKDHKAKGFGSSLPPYREATAAPPQTKVR